MLPSDEEVLWLHVSVYQMLGVDVFYPHQELYGYQEHRLENKINKSPHQFHHICIAILTFNENFLPQISNKSSKLGPSSSITSALYFPQGPK